MPQLDQDFIDAISGDLLKRGEIWMIAGGKDYTGKLRPAVIVQDDRFDATGSITVYVITSDKSEPPRHWNEGDSTASPLLDSL